MQFLNLLLFTLTFLTFLTTLILAEPIPSTLDSRTTFREQFCCHNGCSACSTMSCLYHDCPGWIYNTCCAIEFVMEGQDDGGMEKIGYTSKGERVTFVED